MEMDINMSEDMEMDRIDECLDIMGTSDVIDITLDDNVILGLKIKKPMSAYLWFSSLERQRMKEEGEKMTLVEGTKKISLRWGKLEEWEKKKYIELADDDKERYTMDLAELRLTGLDVRRAVKILKIQQERTPKQKKKRRVKKKISPPGHPKRHLSCFLLFCQDKRPMIRSEVGDSVTTAKKLGLMWQEASEEERNKYRALAAIEKLRYLEVLENFKKENVQEAN